MGTLQQSPMYYSDPICSRLSAKPTIGTSLQLCIQVYTYIVTTLSLLLSLCITIQPSQPRPIYVHMYKNI